MRRTAGCRQSRRPLVEGRARSALGLVSQPLKRLQLPGGTDHHRPPQLRLGWGRACLCCSGAWQVGSLTQFNPIQSFVAFFCKILIKTAHIQKKNWVLVSNFLRFFLHICLGFWRKLLESKYEVRSMQARFLANFRLVGR